jgi:tRNA uridine 5-carboxymethylaminomethyl modification enzyme
MREKVGRIQHWCERLEQPSGPDGRWGDLIRQQGRASGPDSLLAEPDEIRSEVTYRILYRGYLEREWRMVERLRVAEKVRIPEDLDFLGLPGLKHESAQKLASISPAGKEHRKRL